MNDEAVIYIISYIIGWIILAYIVISYLRKNK